MLGKNAPQPGKPRQAGRVARGSSVDSFLFLQDVGEPFPCRRRNIALPDTTNDVETDRICYRDNRTE